MGDCQVLRTCADNYLQPEFRYAHAFGGAQVFADVEHLKPYAKFYLRSELPVATTDPFALGRNYFDRPSSPERETQEGAEERLRILENARRLEDLVQVQHLSNVLETDFFHGDYAVGTKEQMKEEETPAEADRAETLADLEALKIYAKFHLHPELPVETTDKLACGRNFFDRPSAPDRETQEEAEEHHHILEDARHLEDLVQLQHFGRVLQHDYFHCNFEMDEDMVFDASEGGACEKWENEDISDSIKGGAEGNLSRSPSSILQFE